MSELTEGDSCIVIPELIGVPVKFWSCKSCPSPTIKWVDDIAVCCNCGLTNKVKFNDPTLLADLTDEQWREMGFCEYDKNSSTFRHRWESGLYFYYPEDDFLFYDWVQYPNVKTLGQLRAMMFAIGGE